MEHSSDISSSFEYSDHSTNGNNKIKQLKTIKEQVEEHSPSQKAS